MCVPCLLLEKGQVKKFGFLFFGRSTKPFDVNGERVLMKQQALSQREYLENLTSDLEIFRSMIEYRTKCQHVSKTIYSTSFQRHKAVSAPNHQTKADTVICFKSDAVPSSTLNISVLCTVDDNTKKACFEAQLL